MDDLKRFEFRLRRSKSDLTRYNYIHVIKRFLNFTHGSSTLEDVDRFLIHLEEQGASKNTIATYFAAIKAWFKFLGKSQEIETYDSPKREKKEIQVLSPEEVKKLINSIPNPYHKLIVKLMYTVAARVQEIVNLNREDVNLEKKTIKIVRLKKKEKKIDELPLPDSLVEDLRDYLEQRTDDHPALFIGRNGRIRKITIQKMLQNYTKRILNKKRSCHLLRHTRCSELANKITNPYLLQKFLGHEHLTTTQRYIHIQDKNLEQIREYL